MTSEDLAHRVFDWLTQHGISEPDARQCFVIALKLWDEDRQKISKGFERKPGEDQEPARSSRHDIDT